jgi:hypothetical protein
VYQLTTALVPVKPEAVIVVVALAHIDEAVAVAEAKPTLVHHCAYNVKFAVWPWV